MQCYGENVVRMFALERTWIERRSIASKKHASPWPSVVLLSGLQNTCKTIDWWPVMFKWHIKGYQFCFFEWFFTNRIRRLSYLIGYHQLIIIRWKVSFIDVKIKDEISFFCSFKFRFSSHVITNVLAISFDRHFIDQISLIEPSSSIPNFKM